MTTEQQPYLGQRCAVTSPEWKGFGTIIALKDDPVTRKPLARVELDSGGSQWYEVEQLELLQTFPAG
jgi:hypothetical protein